MHRLLLLLLACGVEDARTALIVDTLVEADLDLIAMRPDQVAAKYQAMTETPQTYLRGTDRIFYRDLTRTLGQGVHHGDGAELVWLYGDPHLENVGTTFDDQGAMFDGIDFDGTVQGPFDWDVRRAALAAAVGIQIAGRDDQAAASAARALADGWRAQVTAGSVSLRPADLGKIVQDELAKGASDEAKRQDLTKYTVVIGDRQLLRASDMIEVPAPFKDHLVEALRQWNLLRRGGPVAADWLRIKDAIQRLGSGIASFPNLRFWILIDGPPGLDDDRILELKEERDPPEPIGWLDHGPITPDNGARVLRGTAALLSSPGAEPDLGHVTIEGVAFQVRSVSRGRREINVGDLAADVQSGKYDDNDLADMGRDIGRLLGAGHLHSATAAALLSAAGPSYSDDTAQNAVADRIRLYSDYQLFIAALKNRGPLLGAR